MLLELNSVHAFYGKIEALRGVEPARARAREIVSLLGANGAGKTTTVRTVVGLRGSARQRHPFRQCADRQRPAASDRRSRHLDVVPERSELFPDMSVVDNLEMGAYRRRDRADIHRALDWRVGLFPVLAERRRERAGAA